MKGIEMLKDGWNAFEYRNGVLFLKIENKKVIGQSKFEYDDKLGWREIPFKPYSYLSGEPWLAPQEMIDTVLSNFNFYKPVPSWFNLKVMLLSEIITKDTKHTPTITTKQIRIPNSGILMEKFEPDYYLSMETLKQLTIWDM